MCTCTCYREPAINRSLICISDQAHYLRGSRLDDTRTSRLFIQIKIQIQAGVHTIHICTQSPKSVFCTWILVQRAPASRRELGYMKGIGLWSAQVTVRTLWINLMQFWALDPDRLLCTQSWGHIKSCDMCEQSSTHVAVFQRNTPWVSTLNHRFGQSDMRLSAFGFST